MKSFDVKKYVISQLRRASYRTPMYSLVKQRARVGYGRYLCAACGSTFGPTEVQVDHIASVISPITGWTTYDDYIVRLFCPADALQILCRPCHQAKSNLENSARRRKDGKVTNT